MFIIYTSEEYKTIHIVPCKDSSECESFLKISNIIDLVFFIVLTIMVGYLFWCFLGLISFFLNNDMPFYYVLVGILLSLLILGILSYNLGKSLKKSCILNGIKSLFTKNNLVSSLFWVKKIGYTEDGVGFILAKNVVNKQNYILKFKGYKNETIDSIMKCLSGILNACIDDSKRDVQIDIKIWQEKDKNIGFLLIDDFVENPLNI